MDKCSRSKICHLELSSIEFSGTMFQETVALNAVVPAELSTKSVGSEHRVVDSEGDERDEICEI